MHIFVMWHQNNENLKLWAERGIIRGKALLSIPSRLMLEFCSEVHSSIKFGIIEPQLSPPWGGLCPDTCPPMGKNLGPVALGLYLLSGMYEGINHPMVGSIVKFDMIIDVLQICNSYSKTACYSASEWIISDGEAHLGL